MAITRRRLLFAGAATTVVGAGVARWSLAVAPGALVLSPRELRIVEAMSEVMFPGDPFPLDGIQAGVPAEVDRIVAEMLGPVHATGFRTLLQTLEWGTLASRGRPFTALSKEARADVLERWLAPELHTRRLAAEVFRVVLGMAYFGSPAVLAHLGWRSECSPIVGVLHGGATESGAS